MARFDATAAASRPRWWWLAALAALGGCGAQTSSPGCPPGWTNPPGSRFCYTAVNQSVTWATADGLCRGLAGGVATGTLATVRDANEAAFVIAQRCGVGSARMVTSDMWIGLNDQAQEAVTSRSCCWAWSSGAATGYMTNAAGQS